MPLKPVRTPAYTARNGRSYAGATIVAAMLLGAPPASGTGPAAESSGLAPEFSRYDPP
jgi:hypothetical protein